MPVEKKSVKVTSADLPAPLFNIDVINVSSVLTDKQILPVIAALERQVQQDFAPIWGVSANLNYIPKGKKPSANNWWLLICDDSDQAGALGYHDLGPNGLPIGKIFAGSDIKMGHAWSVTASHELLEMLADPGINLTVLVQSSATARTLFAYEVCDACEDEKFAYKIDGILVSDFVYPAWFQSHSPAKTQFDFCKKIKKPFELLDGGYIGAFKIGDGSGWQQILASKMPTGINFRPRVGSRRERRRTPREQWLVSSV